jgi:transposase
MQMKIAVLGIDLGKNSCSVVGLDDVGAVIKRRRMRRQSIVAFTQSLPACVVAMEACCGAHYLGRLLRSQGHTVRLMCPEYVRPYVKAQKTFDNEFAACARHDADARRLTTIPGIGVLNATALVAAVGNGQTFARGRDLAACLGLSAVDFLRLFATPAGRFSPAPVCESDSRSDTRLRAY